MALYGSVLFIALAASSATYIINARHVLITKLLDVENSFKFHPSRKDYRCEALLELSTSALKSIRFLLTYNNTTLYHVHAASRACCSALPHH
jgi:hypothetical protein